MATTVTPSIAKKAPFAGFTNKLKNTLKRTVSSKRSVRGESGSFECFGTKSQPNNGKLDELVLELEALDIESVDSQDSHFLSSLHQHSSTSTSTTTTNSNATIVTVLPDKLCMNDFEFVKAIGSGSYGYVSLYRHKATQLPCVIKSVSKSMTFLRREQQHALNEREALAILSSTDCPYAIHGYGTFQDETHLHYVMEYVAGGEFFTYMVQYDTFDEEETKFFVTQLLLALEHMHSQDLAYRDIKPENMLVDEKGYIKVCDFGFAKKIGRGERSWTLCGTPEYLARETLLGKGHDKAVDLWAVGIFAYELLAGRTPFEGGSNTGTHTKILSNHIEYPSHLSDVVIDFIESLLTNDPHDRLGCGPQGFKEVYSHPWLRNFDWSGLESKTLVSPIGVTVAHDFDVANFKSFNGDNNNPNHHDLAPVTPMMNDFFKDFDSVFLDR